MLKPGDRIPTFTALLHSGAALSSAKLATMRQVVLYFYPQDNTPTCTDEACNLRDNHAALQKAGYVLYGVSPDTPKKHRNFIAKYNLPFELISDPELVIIKGFGVWGPKKLFGREYDGVLRTTFILEHGVITRVIEEVKSKDHSNQILAF